MHSILDVWIAWLILTYCVCETVCFALDLPHRNAQNMPGLLRWNGNAPLQLRKPGNLLSSSLFDVLDVVWPCLTLFDLKVGIKCNPSSPIMSHRDLIWIDAVCGHDGKVAIAAKKLKQKLQRQEQARQDIIRSAFLAISNFDHILWACLNIGYPKGAVLYRKSMTDHDRSVSPVNFGVSFFPKQFTVGVLNSLLRGVRLFPVVVSGSLDVWEILCLPVWLVVSDSLDVCLRRPLSGCLFLLVYLHMSPRVASGVRLSAHTYIHITYSM